VSGANVGHGHVHPRPDGVKARCGGPGLCPECSREAADLRIMADPPEIVEQVVVDNDGSAVTDHAVVAPSRPGLGHPCPDGGTCHHECAGTAEGAAGLPCFRVLHAGPLTGAFEGDEWPAEIVEHHARAWRVLALRDHARYGTPAKVVCGSVTVVGRVKQIDDVGVRIVFGPREQSSAYLLLHDISSVEPWSPPAPEPPPLTSWERLHEIAEQVQAWNDLGSEDVERMIVDLHAIAADHETLTRTARSRTEQQAELDWWRHFRAKLIGDVPPVGSPLFGHAWVVTPNRPARHGRTLSVSVAQAFHETYERLAPSVGYETRPESAVPWEQVPAENRRLMIDVVDTLLRDGIIAAPHPEGD